jgi:hypothetical protein
LSWAKLNETLKTGKPQSGVKEREEPFDAMYKDPDKLRTFLRAMTGLSMGPAKAIAAKFPWSDYKTFIEVGTAQGGLPV